MSVSIRPLPKRLQEIAQSELNEEPNRVQEYINQVREWLTKQPHLRTRTDEDWLLNFLRCSKYSLQQTKDRLDFYHTMRTLTPDFFGNRDPMLPEIQDILKKGFVIPLLQYAQTTGCVIFLFNYKNLQPEKNSVADLCKTMLMVLDVLLKENESLSISGVLAVHDLNDFSFNYVTQITPAFGKKFMKALEKAYPIRIRGIHAINIPSYMEILYSIFKPFMSEKLKSKVKLFDKRQSNEFFKSVPKTAFPSEYGGKEGPLEEIAAEWKTKVESYRSWFLEDAQYCSDETKRPGKPKTASDVFGMEGSFKKLSID